MPLREMTSVPASRTGPWGGIVGIVGIVGTAISAPRTKATLGAFMAEHPRGDTVIDQLIEAGSLLGPGGGGGAPGSPRRSGGVFLPPPPPVTAHRTGRRLEILRLVPGHQTVVDVQQ